MEHRSLSQGLIMWGFMGHGTNWDFILWVMERVFFKKGVISSNFFKDQTAVRKILGDGQRGSGETN